MILFRAEAGTKVGAGHAMRCLALAQAVLRLGGEAALALDPGVTAVAPRLLEAGVPLVGPEPRTCRAVVLDGYGFTVADEAAWAAAGAVVAVMEDAPGRDHACDLLVDPAPGRTPGDYAPYAPGARLLLGPAYAPVAHAFALVRASALARRELETRCARALVSTGLTDAGGLAPRAAAALQALAGIERIDVAVGAAAASLPALREAAEADARVRLHLDAQDMAGLTAAADLGVGAAGTSSWERCALGLPTVAVAVAANQAANAEALARSGAALVVAPEAIATALAALVPFETRLAMSRAAAALVDGEGAERMARALMALG